MPEVLMDYYKAIEDSSLKMLQAAEAADWDGVVRIESVCAVLIEQLRAHAQSETLSPEARAEKGRIMRRILQNDALIRTLAEPWLEHCEARFSGQQYLH